MINEQKNLFKTKVNKNEAVLPLLHVLSVPYEICNVEINTN